MAARTSRRGQQGDPQYPGRNLAIETGCHARPHVETSRRTSNLFCDLTLAPITGPPQSNLSKSRTQTLVRVGVVTVALDLCCNVTTPSTPIASPFRLVPSPQLIRPNCPGVTPGLVYRFPPRTNCSHELESIQTTHDSSRGVVRHSVSTAATPFATDRASRLSDLPGADRVDRDRS